jgi:anaerobic selenocysteine-containing dehydrogenase/ferredoxin-NADP reductase
MHEEKLGWCALCRSRCGATFFLQDGRLVGAGPDPAHPTGKSLCVKGKAGPELLYSPDRILFPMKRTTPKSADDPGWARIGWDEALRTTGERLRAIRAAHGAEAVAFASTSPASSALSDSVEWIERLARVSGSPNWTNTTEICNWHRDETYAFTYGTALPYPDFQNTDLIVLWGANPSATWLDQATQIAEAKARGARIMVVDPRRAGFAIGAEHWLRVRPGSDGVLALGMLRHLMQRGLFATPFLRRWTNAALLVKPDGTFLRGRDVRAAHPDAFVVHSGGRPVPVRRNHPADAPLLEAADLLARPTVHGSPCRTAYGLLHDAAHVRTLDEVAEAAWVPAEQIVAAAEAIAAAPRVAHVTWTGLGQDRQATQNNRAFAVLMSFKGGHDAPGGNLELPKHPTNPIASEALLDPGQGAKAIGLARRPLGPPRRGKIVAQDLYTAILDGDPYRVHGVVGFGSNLIQAHSDPARGHRAYRALDFYVHCDLFENPTARHADILLPVNTQYEHDGFKIGFGSGRAAEEHIQYRPRLVEPLGESRSDNQVIFALADALGLREHFFGGDIDAGRAYQLAPTGLTLDQVKAAPGGLRLPLQTWHHKYREPRPDGTLRGFDTQTGLVELHSELLVQAGEAGVPDVSIALLPGGGAFPLALTTAKTVYYCHSQHRTLPSLRRREPDPVVQAHPRTAEAAGLEEGDWAAIETPHGAARMKVRHDASLHPRVLKAAYGWWRADGHGANYNALVGGRDDLDRASGTSSHRAVSCRLVPLPASAGWHGFRPLRVVRCERVAEGVTELWLGAPDGAPLPDYRPGQHLTLRVAGPDGARLTRCYSLTGPAIEPGRGAYRLAVRRVRPGGMSEFVNDALAVGDLVQAKPPAGDFVVQAVEGEPIVLVAGGIGITPMLSFLETAAHAGSEGRFHLAYANRSAGSEAFAARIEALQARLPGLTVARFHGTGAAPGARPGRLQPADLFPPGIPPGARVYLCGPPPLSKALRAGLAALGHPADRLHEELFAAPDADPAALPSGPFTVTFARSGVTAVWTRERGSLLELAEASGVAIENGCRAGQCESCEVGIVDGSALHRVPTGHPGGPTCLACQAVPTADLVLDA